MDKHFFFEGVTINPLEVQQESRMRQSAILSTGAGDACGGRGDWGGTETRGDREGPPGSVAVEKPRTEEEAAPGGCEAPRSGHTDFAEPLCPTRPASPPARCPGTWGPAAGSSLWRPHRARPGSLAGVQALLGSANTTGPAPSEDRVQPHRPQ